LALGVRPRFYESSGHGERFIDMTRSISGAAAGLVLGVLLVAVLEANGVFSGHISDQHRNIVLIAASLSILGAIIGGTGDIVAAIERSRPPAGSETK